MGGVAGGAAAGAIAGTFLGPIGTLVGAAAGVVAGAAVGKSVAERIDPTGEAEYWRDEHKNRPYADKSRDYDRDYAAAYGLGLQARENLPGRTWGDTEAELQRDWESSRGTSTPVSYTHLDVYKRQPHYNTPMQNELLWVYEGQTEFWAWVLAARAGLYTPEQAREVLAANAALFEHRTGRRWRNLQDTVHQGIVDFNDCLLYTSRCV